MFKRTMGTVFLLCVMVIGPGAAEANAQAGQSTTTALAVSSNGAAVTTVPSGSVVMLTATVKAGTAPERVNDCETGCVRV